MTRIIVNKLCCRAFITVSLKESPRNGKQKKKLKEKKTGEQLSVYVTSRATLTFS